MVDAPSFLEAPIPFLNIPTWMAILIGAIVFIIYLLLSAKPKPKEFKPIDLKKETKRRFRREYKYFGRPLGKPIYDSNSIESDKPLMFAIGCMKVVEMKEMRRLEPIHTIYSKEVLAAKRQESSLQIYEKPYEQLNADEKKNIHEVAKEELMNDEIQERPVNEKSRIVRGKKLVNYSEPIPMYALKICSPDGFSKLLARVLGVGMDFALFNQNQLLFQVDRILLTSDFQRRTPNDIFAFSTEGKNLLQDISYEVEREAIWQETANQIPRAVHFDTEASKQLIFRREDAKIEREKHKAQSESHEFG